MTLDSNMEQVSWGRTLGLASCIINQEVIMSTNLVYTYPQTVTSCEMQLFALISDVV